MNKRQTWIFFIVSGFYFTLGYRHWHADLRPDDTPLEAGLAFTCKLKSSIPFQGRDRLEKQKEEGLKRRIVCFTIEESVEPLSWGFISIIRVFIVCIRVWRIYLVPFLKDSTVHNVIPVQMTLIILHIWVLIAFIFNLCFVPFSKKKKSYLNFCMI